MGINYFGILEIANPNIRKCLLDIFKQDVTFCQITREIQSKREFKVNLQDVVNMFFYFGQPLNPEDNWYEQFLKIKAAPEIRISIRKLPADKTLLLFLQVGQWRGTRKKLYEEMFEIFRKCTNSEFSWCVRVFSNREKIKKALEV